MKLAIKVYVATLIVLMLVFAVPAQQRSEKDPRNTAPTVGTGGPLGGPTGLFTVYDGQTLRKGEYTLSAALSNYDRDPGNVDITSVPLSFQFGLSNHLEIFFTTEAYRGIKVNSPRNLSGFYLPNSQVMIGGVLRTPPAIVLAPQGPGASQYPGAAVFRPTNSPFAAFPFTGANAGTFGMQFPFFSGPQFGFPTGTNALLGPPVAGGRASSFPGIGSPYGSILPGIVLATTPLRDVNGALVGEGPVTFTVAPSYLPDAPFINRTWGQSSFNSFSGGIKWRMNDVTSPIGYGLIASYSWYLDNANTLGGFTMMQRGAGPGANKGDINVTLFADARLAKWANLSANVGYTYTTNPKSNAFGGGTFTLLDRPDELLASVGADFPVNRYFQPIVEFRTLKYVGSRTPNALERNPMDVIAGFRVYPARWWGVGLAMRYNANQQSDSSFDTSSHTATVILPCRPGVANCTSVTLTNTFTGAPQGFVTSTDPWGYIGQVWVGRRQKRAGEIVNQPANVDSVALGATVITLGCPPGTSSRSGACADTNRMISVSTKASDPENDVLTYNYTVSGGRIVGTGANVQWDLSGAQVGTYTITTGVDDGCGVCGKTDTRTIRVQDCPDCAAPPPTCMCPQLSVSGPSGLTNAGDAMTFTATTSGGTGTFGYTWSVSAGTIESGQGTPSISVRTTREMAGGNVTATVDMSGTDPACNCTHTESATAGVAPNIGSTLVTEFGPAKPDEIKANLDNFYIQLNNSPNSQGYVINYGTPAQIKTRRAEIMKALAFRKLDPSRLTFVDGPPDGSGTVHTKFYLVPAGATPPTP